MHLKKGLSHFIDKGGEFPARCVHEQQVVDGWYLAPGLAAVYLTDHPFHGREYLESGLLHTHIARLLGNGARKVT